MVAVSIVIITGNQAEILPDCLSKAKLITDDIVIVNSGQADKNNVVANIKGCKVFAKKWDGYGANKNKGIDLAKYDWVLSIDADEVPDAKLIKSLHELNLSTPTVAYDIKFRSYFGDKMIRFGCWGKDHHIRLFNRKSVRWADVVVHETLLLPQNIKIIKINGYLHHYTVKDADEYDIKSKYYASLSAVKYLSINKKSNFIKRHISPVFGFFKNYVFFLGFLDGREGWEIARIIMKNTRRKYRLLNHMQNDKQKGEVYKDSFAVEYQ